MRGEPHVLQTHACQRKSCCRHTRTQYNELIFVALEILPIRFFFFFGCFLLNLNGSPQTVSAVYGNTRSAKQNRNCAGFGQKLFPASECKQCRQERGAFRIGAVPVAAQYAARVAVGKGCGFVPVRQIRQPPLQRFRKCRRLDVCAPRFISPEW